MKRNEGMRSMAETEPHFADLSVLLVEDEKFALRFEKMILKQIGFGNIHEAETAEAAVTLLESGAAVDLVISDMNMPGMDGLGLLDEIRLRWPHLPFVMLTGNIDEGRVRDALGHGVDAYVTKPCSIDQVRDQVCLALRARKAA